MRNSSVGEIRRNAILSKGFFSLSHSFPFLFPSTFHRNLENDPLTSRRTESTLSSFSSSVLFLSILIMAQKKRFSWTVSSSKYGVESCWSMPHCFWKVWSGSFSTRPLSRTCPCKKSGQQSRPELFFFLSEKLHADLNASLLMKMSGKGSYHKFVIRFHTLSV